MTTFLQIMTALPSLIKTISELMNLAEEAMGAGKGADKKASVLATIEAMIANADLWAKTQSVFSGIINMVSLFRFGSSGKDPVAVATTAK